jgi:4'-phosphopantetheinyl transferase
MNKRISKITLFDPVVVADVDTWMFDLEHITENEVSEANLYLNLEEMKRAQRFVFDQHRRHFIVRWAFLKIVLSQYINIDPKAVQIAYGQYKKPYLENNEHIYFNFSHTETKGVLGVTKMDQIGVDIEPIRSIEDRNKMLEHFAEANERVWVGGSLERFFILWTMKEALIKCQGIGFLVDTVPSLETFPVEISKHTYIARSQGYCIYSTRCEKYRISICRPEAYFNPIEMVGIR